MVFRCSVRARYDAALRISGVGEGSSRTHGHGYTVEAVIEAKELDANGFVVDFEIVEPELKRITAELDHRLLNELEPFAGSTPSAEHQARYLFSRLSAVLAARFGDRVRLDRIRVIQEPDAWVEYQS